MHEFSLIADLLRKIETVSRENADARVLSVKVKLGALSHISSDHFREHFEHAIKNTVIEGAKLEVEDLTDIHDPNAQEIILDSVEVEDSNSPTNS